ncbi:MAG: SpoIIE family protein phosphatase [Chthoniobacteraceae bacterium]
MNPPAESAEPGIEILIVEDSLTQALKLQHVLERHDYVVTTARNGKDALAQLAAHAPALVITDINMPEMDGYELCTQIKDDPKFNELPVILLTALSDPRDILHGLESGADNFIVKPYDEEFLLSRIHFVMANLELRRQSRGKGATEIFFAGHKYQLTADRIHSIDLLLSTYETAVHKNQELSRAKEELEQRAEQLREKNEEMAADLEMARELQTAFLPRQYPVFPADASPERSALNFCHRYSTTSELGGDFFDILVPADTAAGIFVCDVMGHGVRAALVTAIIRGLVEDLKTEATDPEKFMTELNRNLCSILQQTVTPLFASAFYAVADLTRGELRYANAGHPAPLHVRRSAQVVEPLKVAGSKPGPVLGLFDQAEYPISTVPLTPGDLVMLFTDGLYEVEGPGDVFYEMSQLHEAVRRRQQLPTPRLFDELVQELRAFSANGEFGDDMCLVGMDVARLL